MAILESTVIEFDLTHRTLKKVSPTTLEIDPHNKHLVYWVHCNLTERETFDHLVKKLKLPDEMIALCNSPDAMAKLIDTEEALTLQLQSLSSNELDTKTEVEFSNLIIHLTNQFCFTASTEFVPALSEFILASQKAIKFAKTPCFILFLIIDSIINDYARMVFHFEVLTDQMDHLIRADHRDAYNEVMDIKQQVMKIKRYNIAITEILMRISSRQISVISEQCRNSLSNLSNHGEMVVHETDSVRDILNGLLDQIDNALMQKMNETMKVLTAFAAVFLPLTLITGIYGMNFQNMPELSWKYGYEYAIGLIIICACILLFIFKRKKWF